MSTGIFRQMHITLDVNSFEPTASFWGKLIGQEPGPVRGNAEYQTIGELPGGGWLTLQKVPELKTAKLRMHLDLIVDDVDIAIAEIIGLGGGQVGKPRVGGGVTMVDPERNEFCIGAFNRSKEGVRTPVEKAQ